MLTYKSKRLDDAEAWIVRVAYRLALTQTQGSLPSVQRLVFLVLFG
jgi:hypothetical protein